MAKDHQYLLPAGLKDGLPPDAAFEAAIVERLMACFSAWGYDRVKPPLIEFEDALLSGMGAAMASDTFRLMDPVSQRMMGLRADMTPQVGRIAASRLKGSARPLRLSYAGQVLRVKGEQMRPERQIGQAGVELIGVESAAADAEAVLLAAEALKQLGVAALVVDLNAPKLALSYLRESGVADPAPTIAALDRKDAAAVKELGGKLAPTLQQLMNAIGTPPQALDRLAAIALTKGAAAQRDRLIEVATLVQQAARDLGLNIDPTDHRGFEYHTGVTFSLLGRGVSGEFGRGGRYVNQAGEDATGFTLYLDTLSAALPAPKQARRILLPRGTSHDAALRLRQEGWITIHALDNAEDEKEARRLGCTHLWRNGAVQML
ncbi:MAG TPA: ATP phosphoribosyltransferase regulatory subunit [Dongiaceae bacterium]|jgi:ATP phosphoribosyltransferase regulatory subunit|nr:ATP phosphoribosyltransferase regulatory subunit [Dongiaceae bacterium]